jgi:glutamate carboxypeptidase
MVWEDRLREVVLINSHTFNKAGVDRVGRVFSRWFREIGFEIEIFQRELIGDHLLFRSRRASKQRILLLGHLDTVFPKGEFEGFSWDDEWVYGAGVCDMKGGNIVALEALREVYKEFGEVFDIDMLLVSDEETGSDDSRAVTQKLAKDYDICFVFEAGGENLEVVVGRKGIGTFEIEITGRASHAGVRYQDGVDANRELAHKLIALSSLTDLKKGTTVNVGKVEGGIGANTISPSSKLLLELRYANQTEKERVLNSLKNIVDRSFITGTKSKLSGNIQRDVMEPNQQQRELISKIELIGNCKLPTESRGGVSDANLVSSCGVVTIDGFGPFGDGDHTIKERALKVSFDKRIELMSRVLKYHQKKGVIYG